MWEVGVDIGQQTSKAVDRYLATPFDYVITVCDHANESCPTFTGQVRRRLHWSFEDPVRATGSEEEVLAKYREVRDLIRKKIGEFFSRPRPTED